MSRAALCAAACLLAALLPLGASWRAEAANTAAAANARAAATAAVNATAAGEVWTEPPTLQSLGFEWHIAGDDNRNAIVEVTYRRQGETQWHRALPLLRLQDEQVNGSLAREGGGHHFNYYVAPDM